VEINNEIRRTRTKLDVLTAEGMRWFLRDFCDKIDLELQQEVPDDMIDYFLHCLKIEYQVEINHLKDKDGKQQTLF
jgi:hypothetical protein